MKWPGFGESATAALLVSVLSGFVIAFQYEPAAPFISTVAMEAELPFGAFWRSLHFWSSQVFVLLLLLHVIQRFDTLDRISPDNASNSRGRNRWAVTSITFPLAVMALFTGYVLRFDGTGQAAGAIAEHLLSEIPLAGHTLNRFLMAVEREGVNRVYAVHIALTALCWGVGTWYHTGKALVKKEQFLLVASLIVLWAILINAPVDLPGENRELLKGPWFFVGIQEMLRDLPPIYAGIMFPAIPAVVLTLLPWIRTKQNAWFILGLWTVLYTLFTVMGFART